MTIRDVAARACVSPATVSRVFTQPESVASDTRQRVLAAAAGTAVHPAPGRALAGPPPHRQPRHRRARHRQLVLRSGDQGGPAGGAAGRVRAVRRGLRGRRRRRGAVHPGTRPAGGRLAAGVAAAAGRRSLLEPGRGRPGGGHQPGPRRGSPRSSPSRHPRLATPSSTCTLWATATWSTWPDPTASPTPAALVGLRTTTLPRLGLGADGARPLPRPVLLGVRAADLVLATGATGVIAYQRRHRRRTAQTASPTAGSSVPEDVSVTGHDDTALAEMVTPRLTTVRIPAATTGATAAQLLIRGIRGRERRGPSEPSCRRS